MGKSLKLIFWICVSILAFLGMSFHSNPSFWSAFASDFLFWVISSSQCQSWVLFFVFWVDWSLLLSSSCLKFSNLLALNHSWVFGIDNLRISMSCLSWKCCRFWYGKQYRDMLRKKRRQSSKPKQSIWANPTSQHQIRIYDANIVVLKAFANT